MSCVAISYYTLCVKQTLIWIKNALWLKKKKHSTNIFKSYNYLFFAKTRSIIARLINETVLIQIVLITLTPFGVFSTIIYIMHIIFVACIIYYKWNVRFKYLLLYLRCGSGVTNCSIFEPNRTHHNCVNIRIEKNKIRTEFALRYPIFCYNSKQFDFNY